MNRPVEKVFKYGDCFRIGAVVGGIPVAVDYHAVQLFLALGVGQGVIPGIKHRQAQLVGRTGPHVVNHGLVPDHFPVAVEFDQAVPIVIAGHGKTHGGVRSDAGRIITNVVQTRKPEFGLDSFHGSADIDVQFVLYIVHAFAADDIQPSQNGHGENGAQNDHREHDFDERISLNQAVVVCFHGVIADRYSVNRDEIFSLSVLKTPERRFLMSTVMVMAVTPGS